MNWLPVLAHALAVEVVGPTLSSLTTKFRKKKEPVFAILYWAGVVWFWFHTKPRD